MSSVSARPTSEMVRRFERRTLDHIARVKSNLAAMEGFLGLDAAVLLERGDSHDRSKFDPKEREGYAWLTWMYRCRELRIDFAYPPAAAGVVERALERHRARERHHPEAHPTPDAMTELDVVEMVCDWTAIAQENGDGGGSAWGWAARHVERRWVFSRGRLDLIFRTIEELDRRRERPVVSTGGMRAL